MILCFMERIINLLFKEKYSKLLKNNNLTLSYVSELKLLLLQKYILQSYIFQNLYFGNRVFHRKIYTVSHQ